MDHFIILTQIEATEYRTTTSTFDSEVVGKIAVPKDLLRTTAIIMENKDLHSPVSSDKRDESHPTTEIFFPDSNITISVSEKWEDILKILKEK